MLAIERRSSILKKLQIEKKVFVTQLSKSFNVSEETVRRDLDKLCKEGLVIKTHGGAILNDNTEIDLPFNLRKKRNVEGKKAIAKIMETLINDGDHIILDASTTAVFIAKAIKHKNNLTVLTNSIEIIIELSDVTGWDIISCGGTLKGSHLALFGATTLESLSRYYADKFIFSCKGLDMARGITDVNDEFANTKMAMLKSSQKSFLLVDNSKFGNIAFSKITDISTVDTIITDRKPNDEWAEIFKNANVECLYPTSPYVYSSDVETL